MSYSMVLHSAHHMNRIPLLTFISSSGDSEIRGEKAKEKRPTGNQLRDLNTNGFFETSVNRNYLPSQVLPLV